MPYYSKVVATYKIEISPHDGESYDIHIVSEGGARQTILGFRSREEAEEWIIVDRARGRINQGPEP